MYSQRCEHQAKRILIETKTTTQKNTIFFCLSVSKNKTYAIDDSTTIAPFFSLSLRSNDARNSVRCLPYWLSLSLQKLLIHVLRCHVECMKCPKSAIILNFVVGNAVTNVYVCAVDSISCDEAR